MIGRACILALRADHTKIPIRINQFEKVITTMKNIRTSSSLKRLSGFGVGALIIVSVVTPLLSYAALTRQLDLGATGADVSELQTFLAQDRSIYPQGLVTGYFGTLTSAAVSNFQARNGLDNVGRVGPLTITRINAQMTGGMATGADVSAPTIYNVSVSTSTNTATISWNTNEMAKGVVYYGTSPLTEYELPHTVTISGSVAMTDTSMRTAQSVVISNLQANTVHYYDIYVTDGAGNVSMTMQSSFRTAP